VKKFFIECISLSTSSARLTVLFVALLFLCLLDLSNLGIPDLCIWEKMFGFCPAEGTLHSLTAFLEEISRKA